MEYFNANCDISYLSNKFTIDHNPDIVSRQIYSRYLVIVLDVRCAVVFFRLSWYLTENTARTSYEYSSRREIVCVRRSSCKMQFLTILTKIEIHQPIPGKKFQTRNIK